MDATIYFAVGIIAAIVLLAAFLSWSSRRQRKKLKKHLYRIFDNFVISNNLTIEKKQKANCNVIGIDRINYKLVFYDGTINLFHLIDLSEISSCRMVREKNEESGHISRIYLQCISKDHDVPPVNLPFYDSREDNVYRMLRLAKKAAYWQSSINIYRKAAVLAEKIRKAG